MFTNKLFLAAIAAIACAALAAGCGSDNDSSASSNTNTSKGAYGPPANKTATVSPVTIVTKKSKDGTILAGSRGRTLYLFEADKNGSSSCSGACASAWPPAFSNGSVKASGGADQSKVGKIKRSDGTIQATYAGHPLYYYVKDADAKDVYGNGVDAFGAEWYALAPSGKAAEE